MYLVSKFSHLDFCATVKLTNFSDFAAGIDNVPDV